MRWPAPAVPEAPARDAAHEPVPARNGLGWQAAVASTVAGLGYDLVDIERGQRGLLRVYIDRLPGRSYMHRHGDAVDDGEFVTVEDCEVVTRQLQYALEVEGLDYARLEVSSPGLDRPLKRETDYLRFAGQVVQVTLKVAFQNRKNWQGILGAVVDETGASTTGWSLRFDEGGSEQQLNFSFEEVREARLVPAVDFKGRKSRAAAAAGHTGAAVLAPKEDGDRNR